MERLLEIFVAIGWAAVLIAGSLGMIGDGQPVIGTMNLCFFGLLPLLIYYRMVHRAKGESLSFLTVWMEEQGMSLLRQRRWGALLRFNLPDSWPSEDLRIIYRVSAEDRAGRTRTGWVAIIGRTAAGEFIPHRAEARWGRVRATAKPVKSSAGSRVQPLWDDWIDARSESRFAARQ